MDLDEVNREILECARYGEHEELQQYLQSGGDVNYQDDSGNTAMHKAAANDHVECLAVLKSFGAKYLPNAQGNYPLHWAAQNRKLGSLKFIINNYDVDILAQNSFGKSILTEAFQSQDTDIIEACLSHPSSTEEKLIQANSSTPNSEVVIEGDNDADAAKHAVYHKFSLDGDPNLEQKLVQIRELPITRADNPFGSETSPEDDTTGLGIWPASILAARWALSHWKLLENKVVAELGAGCGLPGLAIALRSQARKVYLTDIHEPTLLNCNGNVRLNIERCASEEAVPTTLTTLTSSSPPACESSSNGHVYETHTIYKSRTNIEDSSQVPCDVSVLLVNWADRKTFPQDSIDVLIGSDLVYDVKILGLLVPAIKAMLALGGSFLYVAPIEGRDGMDQFAAKLTLRDPDEDFVMQLVEEKDCPEEFFANPLAETEESSDLFVLHFYDLSIKKPHILFRFQKVSIPK